MNLKTESTKEKLLNIVSSFNTTPFLFIGSGITRRYCNLPSWDLLLEYFSNLLNPSNEFAYPNYKRQANNDYSLLGSIIVNDTLRMYKNDDIRMYNFNCITDTIVEVITTCNTYTLLTVHLL